MHIAQTMSLLGAIVLLAAPASAALLTNGSFEPGTAVPAYTAVPGGALTVPGWLATDTGVEWFDPSVFGAGAAADGHFAVDLANLTFSAGGIQQTFATVPGQAYVITFSLGTTEASGRDGTAEIEVSADGTTQTFATVNHALILAWGSRSFTFVADDLVATLRFRCLQDANLHFADIDAVEANIATAAAPTSWGRLKSLYR